MTPVTDLTASAATDERFSRKATKGQRRGDEIHLLFDPPGPRARRRIRIATAFSAVVLAALLALAVRQFALHGQLDRSQWWMFGQWPVQRFLLGGLGHTLLATAVAAALAFPLGGVVAHGRLARNRLIRGTARTYVELFRSVPLLLLMYIFLFGLPSTGLIFPVFWQLVIPIVLGNAAVVAEIYRAGVLNLPHGQTEAAYSIGMTHGQAMRYVVVPQALRTLAPALVSQLVRLLKDSTLGYVVSYLELLHQAKVLGEYYHAVLSTYLVAAAAFIAVNAALSRTASYLEARRP
ncbi:amino acid ABC transporter permease [Streptomyces chartreusis]|uniref:Amino acid ABC transporter permease n=1 Tax=Streptomyces chartreusis TaxID=1969 RepID=A0A7H8TIQ2_STRCX|nr:amino acid ABC transporter permease [Streptomyces chartreusis]QKZ23423.1 amino acid ABC transporter permease [Streptomyces chartreusis]